MIEHRRPSHRATARPFAALAACIAVLLVADGAWATPRGITFASISPSDGGNTLFVARTAANNPLLPPTFQLKADVCFDNSGAAAEVTDVTFRYPGSSIPATSNTPKRPGTTDNWTLLAGGLSCVPISHGLDVDLPTPLPATVEIDIEFDHDGAPELLTRNLAFYENAVPLGAFFFPARAADLGEGEYWFWEKRHVGDTDARYGARYALDMGVAGWNGLAWSDIFDGTSGAANTDFRVWNKPLYSMGDGVIVACYRGETDRNPGPWESVPFGAGNSLFIQYGGDLVLIAHLQKDTTPESLCPTPASPGPGLWPSTETQTGLTIPVVAGQYLGRVGNTGYSTAPHLHLEVNGPPSVSGAPLQFVNVRALADDTYYRNISSMLPPQPLHRMILHRQAIVLPNPCGFDLPPAGGQEISRHGVTAECFQDEFNLVVARGYALKFVDGYEVGGQTYFNATFRPANAAWIARFGLTGAEYQALFNDLVDQGYRLHQVDSYIEGGHVRYAAIFEIRPGHPFSAFHGLTGAEYESLASSLRNEGYVPVNLSTVEVLGVRLWTGLFEQVSVADWSAQSVPAASYQDVSAANVEAGRLPIHVNGDTWWGEPFLTGIWVRPIGGSWAAAHDMTDAEFQAKWVLNALEGRLTRSTAGYDAGAGSARFAAVWRGSPDTFITGHPDGRTNQTTATFVFGSDNPFATFECRFDHDAFAPCASPMHLDALAEGSHRLDVQALDRDRVRDPSPASFTWLVDTTPPEIAMLEPAPNAKTVYGVPREDPVDMTTVVGWADVAASVTDDRSGVDAVVFRVDGVQVPGAAVSTVGGVWRFEFRPDQQNGHIYTIEAIATDHAGNTAAKSIEVLGVRTMKKREGGPSS